MKCSISISIFDASNLFMKSKFLILIQLPSCCSCTMGTIFCGSGISSGDEKWSIFLKGKNCQFPTSHFTLLRVGPQYRFQNFAEAALFRFEQTTKTIDLIITINQNFTHAHTLALTDSPNFQRIFFSECTSSNWSLLFM